jgi:hypothetical protein
MELENWYQAIAGRRWPILPATRADLRHICSRHTDLIHFTDLANLCLSDPLLLFDLLRLVGGSRALQRNESNPAIEQMLMMVGLEGLIHRFNPLQAITPLPGQLDPETIEAVGDWMGRSRVAALIVKEWLSIAKESRVDDCFVAALLYNLPACFYLLFRNQVPEKPLLQAVADQFGSDYPKVLAGFVEATSLPKALLQLYGAGSHNLRRQLLRLAVATANALEQGWWRSQWIVGVEAAAHLMGCNYDTAYAAVGHAVLSVANHPRAPGYTYSARQFILLQGDYKPAELKVAAVLSGPEQLEQVLRESIRLVANELKFERVIFWRHEPHTHQLRLRYQIGLREGHPLRKLPLSLEDGSFLGLLASKPQGFHALASVRAQLGRKYHDPFFQHIGDAEFAIMAVYTGDELAGVFYADNPESGRPISENTYVRFKTLITQKAPYG